MEAEIPVTVQRDVRYLPEDRAECLDLHFPAEDGPPGLRSALVFLHGGSFYTDDKASRRSQSMCATLAGAGHVTASVNYALSDGPTGDERWTAWPRNVWDCAAAVQYLRRHAAELRVDPARIGAFGVSAGGTLALLLAFAGLEDLPGEPAVADQAVFGLRAAVNIYGRADHNVHTGPEKTPSCTDTLRAASPVCYLAADSGHVPPILTVHGDADDIVPFAQALHLDAALRAVHGSHTLHVVPGATHTFDLTPPQGDLRPVVLGFLAEHLR